MATSVRLDDDFVTSAMVAANVEERSVPKQIQYWAKIGKMMLDNPDLSYNFVRETLTAQSEIEAGLAVPYVRRTRNK